MKRLFLFIMTGMLLFPACEKREEDGQQGDKSEQPEDDETGCITGKITIFNTGSVTDAYIRLSLSENGDAVYGILIEPNGDYRIDNVKDGRYFFRVFKEGFVDTLFNEAISIQPKILNGGSCRQMDWAISKLPPNLYIVEVGSERRINAIDFGRDESRLYFQIYNNSANTYTWFTDFNEVKLRKKWLDTMNPIGGILRPNDPPVTITLTIDRSKLESATNSAKFLIDSDKGGGEVLTVTATGF